MKYCENCGAELQDGIEFCDECGTKVKTSGEMNKDVGTVGTVGQGESPKKKSRKGIVVIVILIILLLLAGSGVALWKLGVLPFEMPKKEVVVKKEKKKDVINRDDLLHSVKWKEDAKKIEEWKGKTITQYKDKSIGESYGEGYSVTSWKQAEKEKESFLLCTYAYEDKAYQVIFYKDAQDSITVAELYEESTKQSAEAISKYCEEMFMPKAKKAKGNPSDYIFPESDTRYLTEDEIQNKDTTVLKLARNEIFARYGLIFQGEDLVAYFTAKPWYEGSIASQEEFDKKVTLNEFEKANVDKIKSVEESKLSLSESFYPVMGSYNNGSDEECTYFQIDRTKDDKVYIRFSEYFHEFEGTITGENRVVAQIDGTTVNFVWTDGGSVIVTYEGMTPEPRAFAFAINNITYWNSNYLGAS